MAHTRHDALQLPLPFPATRRQRVEHGARRAGDLAAAALHLLVRWVLRIALPLVCAAAALQAFPYHATVQGVPFEVQGSLFSRPGLSADTTLGSWEFPTVSGVPFGVHISPEDVDVLALTKLAGGDVPSFVQRLQADLTGQAPEIIGWLVAEFLLGLAVGLAIAAAVNMSVRYLRGWPRRAGELRRRVRQAGTAALVTLAVAAYGALSYNPNWVRESQLTGTLAAAQLFPSELSAYYSQQSKAFDVLGSVVGIQAALQAQIEDDQTPETALQIMTIADMHLAANYPLVARYAANYDVDLIVNAGDESEFGTAAELTPSYLDAVRSLTDTTPMLWIAGNHDSPATAQVMRGIPGVTVLGTKTTLGGGGYRVTAGVVDAFGLTIAGLSDPRVYGATGPYGADDASVVEPLQRETVRAAVGSAEEDAEATTSAARSSAAASSAAAPSSSDAAPTGDVPAEARPIDLFAVHEPVAAEELREVLPDRVRQTVSGHVHAQNDSDDVQAGDATIDLVEGSTGAGGLDNLVRGTERPPIEFSIESVSADCQFTRVVRFSIASAAPVLGGAPEDVTTPQAFGDDVTASTLYFRPQDVAPDRVCGPELGVGPEEPWPGS
ncbi:metallophosphoesterase [Modestobacter muralis]|uniref:Metallophosphoesterase n=1 Tax=Modestobacter muralis TaxID=1608614 RepID=A0A6P0EPQ8_9ACTN|nr:metallophosphoesterase [Modestobacter muralis]NEK92753.1 metallophosphoesterase [Modestobacter muralis]NEN49520.1 metallophosphoesterase [Modestobacter muralis]